MSKVLLTGATGFIGIHTLNCLIEKGYDVYIIGKSKIDIQRCTWHHCDLHNLNHVYELMEHIEPDYLIHLSWDVNPRTYVNSINNYDWVISSFNLIKAFYNFGGKRALLAGSCFEYQLNHNNLVEYGSPLSFSTPYSSCKNSLQIMVNSFSETVGLSIAWARIFFLYGPWEKEFRLVPNIVTSLLQDKKAICRSGNLVRDYLYVKDVADSLVSILESKVEGIINVGSGKGNSIKNIVEIIAKRLNKSHLLEINDTHNTNETTSIVANVQRLRDEVNWQPSYSLDVGIGETIKWWERRISGGKYEGKLSDM